MADIILPPKGVVTLPPSAIRESIRSEVDKALAEIPAGKQGMAQVNISLKDGVNVAYATKLPSGWTAVVYVGRKWDSELIGGAHVSKTW